MYNGFVELDGEIMIQLAADNDHFCLYSRDGEDSYPNASGLPNCQWTTVPETDPRITDDDRAILAWLLE